MLREHFFFSARQMTEEGSAENGEKKAPENREFAWREGVRAKVGIETG